MDRGEKTDRLTMFMKTRAKKTKNNEGQQVESFDEEAAAIIVSNQVQYNLYIYIMYLYIHISLLPFL